MDYREWPPRSRLAPYVRCLWIFEAGQAQAAPQRIVPDGRCELVLHLARPFAEVRRDGTEVAQPRALFAGQLTRPLLLVGRGRQRVVGVRFHATGARAFLGQSLEDVTDRRVPVKEAFGLAAALRDEPARRVAARVQDFVEARIRGHRPVRDEAVERCVRAIESSRGLVPVEALLAVAGLGRRQLERRFAACVGLGPAGFAAILRFRRVFDVIERDASRPWTEAALEAGFFDQSHFIREFRRLVGCTPTAFAREAQGLAEALARPQA